MFLIGPPSFRLPWTPFESKRGKLTRYPFGITDGNFQMYDGAADLIAAPGIAVIQTPTGVTVANDFILSPIPGDDRKGVTPVLYGIDGQDGMSLEIINMDAKANTVTCLQIQNNLPTPLILDGTNAPKQGILFAAFAGGVVKLKAVGGFWVAECVQGATLTEAPRNGGPG